MKNILQEEDNAGENIFYKQRESQISNDNI